MVAAVNQNGTLNITGSMFDGKLLTTSSTNSCAGFVGYNGATVNITNCLYAPADPKKGETWVGTSGSATFARGYTPTITNCYYTRDFNDGTNYTGQGKEAYDAAAAPVGGATHAKYTVSGITPYANGLVCGGCFYYGDGDNVSVSYMKADGSTNSHSAIVLGWTNTDDYIHVGSYYCSGTIILADAFIDAGGTMHTAENVGTLAGKILTPAVVLADAVDNSTAITDHHDMTLAVQLYGRTLYKDGAWNTLCRHAVHHTLGRRRQQQPRQPRIHRRHRQQHQPRRRLHRRQLQGHVQEHHLHGQEPEHPLPRRGQHALLSRERREDRCTARLLRADRQRRGPPVRAELRR